MTGRQVASESARTCKRSAFAMSLALCLLTAIGSAHAAWVPVASPVPAPLTVTVRETAPDRTVIEFILPGYDENEVMVEGERCVALAVPGEALLMTRGFPELPMARRSVAIDDLMPVSVRVLEMDRVTAPIARVVPSKGHLPRNIDPATVPWEFGPVYGEDAFYPAEQVSSDDPFVVRDLRGVTVEFRPLAYQPVRGELSICRRLVVEVTRGSGAAVNPLLERPRGGDDGVFQDIYRQLFVNYDRVASLLYAPVTEPGRLVIITADAFYADVLPLAAWKRQMGRPTDLVRYSELGAGAATIKSYIQSQYGSSHGLTYVILVGDVAQIPTLYGTFEAAPSDPCYAKMTVGDHYPDLLVSRISAQTSAQVAAQVAKIIRYERDPDTGAAAAWYREATGIASNDAGGTPYRDWQRMDFLRADLTAYGYTTVDQIYDPGASDVAVRNALNAGRSLLNYIGHGSGLAWSTSGFDVNDARALTNGHRQPIVVDVACSNGDFTLGESLAEALLRSGTPEAPKGAIAMYAASTLASWVPPCDMQTEVIDLMLAGQRTTVGGLYFSGAMKVLDMWGAGEGTKLVEQYNIFGDCSLVPRTRVPSTLSVAHAPSLPVFTSSFAVDVPGAAGALAALYGNDLLYGFAYTDASGHAVITMADPPSTAGTMKLTVTAPDRVPYMVDIPVIAIDGPYLVCVESTLDDDASGSSSGNGDGLAGAGEHIAVDVRLWNMGSEVATGTVATLATTSPWVTLIDGSAAAGDIVPGDTAVVDDGLVFAISPECPDGEVVSLTLDFTTGSDAWSQEITFPVHAAVLSLVSCNLADAAPGGDGDGMVEGGETITLRVRISNAGSAAADGVAATLISGVPVWAGVVDDEAGIPAIAPGATVQLAPDFRLTVSGDAPPTAIMPLMLELAGSWELAWSAGFDLAIGGIYETVELGPGTWTHSVVTPTFIDQWHRNMSYNHTPGGRWAWKFGQPVDGAYGNRADGVLVSEPIETGPGSELRFWHRMDADLAAGFPGYCYDGGVVEVSMDGGPWHALTPTGGYPHRIRTSGSPGPFAAETPCYSGTHGWQEAVFDLSGETGMARIRFRFGSDGSVGRDGWVIDDIRMIGGETPATDVGGSLTLVPDGMLRLSPGRPNPFQRQTEIEMALPRDAEIDLAIYDVAGRRIRALANGVMPAGFHVAAWDGRDAGGQVVAPGVYYCRLTAGAETVSRAVVMTR